MICNNCQKTIPDDADFCKYCGSPAPFSSGINYHPETMFSAEPGTGNGAVSDSVKTALSEMEGRLNEKFAMLIRKRGSKVFPWQLLQTIATIILIAGMVFGVLLLVKTNARLDQINSRLENAEAADSELKADLGNLAKLQETQEKMQTDLEDLLSDKQTSEKTAEDSARSAAGTITFHSNFDPSGAPESIASITTKPGDVISLKDAAAPTRDGYTLIGWNTAANGEGAQYAPDGMIGYFGRDIDLYAIWKADSAASAQTENPEA